MPSESGARLSPMRTVAVLLCLGLALQAQDHFRKKNKALLGIVAIEVDERVVIGHVLDKSPAKKAKLKTGDVLVEIAGKRIRRHSDVDAALSDSDGGDRVMVVYKRDVHQHERRITLAAWKDYSGKFLPRRKRSETGFKAPGWWAFAWGNLGDRKEPPTLLNTKGKIVVIHAFQSW